MKAITSMLPEIPFAIATRVLVALLIAASSAYFATPKLSSIEAAPSLEDTVPRAFGDWVEVTSPLLQVSLTTGGETDFNQPYDQVAMRSYRNSAGDVVQLALAWGGNQRQEVKIHRPDLCYVAQGYRIRSLVDTTFEGIATQQGRAVIGKRMLAEARTGVEAVSYWIRIGDVYSEDAIDTRLKIFRDGLAGRIPDGMLVRASMSGRDEKDLGQKFPVIEAFLAELVMVLPPSTRALLVK